MISLTCTNCKQQLSIDDAFAGGVCRCQHCGAIQTVPSHLKRKAGALSATGAADSSKSVAAKTLYQKQSRASLVPGTGLEDLADAVASSGLSSQRLRDANAPGARPKPTLSPSLVLGVAVSFLVICGLALWLFSSSGREKSTASTPPNSSPPNSPAAQIKSPNFCGTPLDDRIVVYVIDRGSATSDIFGYLKEACFKSVESLGPERKFQIVFWNNGSDAAYPNAGPTFANAANIEQARRALEDVSAHGQSDVTSALTRAVASNPNGTIVLATAKGEELNDDFVKTCERIRGTSGAKIHTFAVGAGEPGTALKSLASSTGGKFAAVPTSALREAAE